jgi:Outer membrane efflux protein
VYRTRKLVIAFLRGGTTLGATVAGWRQFSRIGVLVACLFAGRTSWQRPVSLPPELTEAGVQARLRMPAGPHLDLAATGVRPGPRNYPSHTLALNPGVEPEPSAFSLADAIAFAQQHSPRLQAARAAIERARGQEQVAVAPFLPEVALLSQAGATSDNAGPGILGLTGSIRPSTPGTHRYVQAEVQLLWTVYDFGRRTGRYQQAAARERIAALQLARADQTVQFDATAAYLNILLARASLRVQEEAIRQAEATLKDAQARFEGGVADPDDVLRAEVQLAESRDAFVSAQEAELVAVAQLNNVMGRNAALPLRVLDLQPPPPQGSLPAPAHRHVGRPERGPETLRLGTRRSSAPISRQHSMARGSPPAAQTRQRGRLQSLRRTQFPAQERTALDTKPTLVRRRWARHTRPTGRIAARKRPAGWRVQSRWFVPAGPPFAALCSVSSPPTAHAGA